MSQQELVKRAICVLERLGLEYMITGSIVSSIQGEPRSTHDIDIVVALERSAAGKLLEAFASPDFYLDEGALLSAIDDRSTFNVIDTCGGGKIDFWILTDGDFDRSRFSRKYLVDFLGFSIWISTPEDTILAKLNWAKLSGGSHKQFMDALRVYEVQRKRLDLEYISNWAQKLDIVELWRQLRDEATIL